MNEVGNMDKRESENGKMERVSSKLVKGNIAQHIAIQLTVGAPAVAHVPVRLAVALRE